MPSPFDPAPALPGWNYDWTSDPSAATRAMFDKRVVNIFIDAVNERLALSTRGALAHAATDDVCLTKWGDLVSKLYDVAGDSIYWLPGYASGGGLPDYLTTTVDPATTLFGAIPDWFVAMFKRRYPREIATLTATNAVTLEPAATGQIARLIQASSAGGSNSGQLFLRSSGGTSGTWDFDPSATRPDVIAYTNTASGSGLPLKVVSGDYFVAEFLNELRDLINQYVQVGVGVTLVGAESSTSNPPGSYAVYGDAVADYNTNLASVTIANIGGTPQDLGGYIVGGAPSGPYSIVNSGFCSARASYAPATNVGNFDAYFISTIRHPIASGIFAPGTFNDYGSGYTVDYSNPLSNQSAASGSVITSALIGYTSAPGGGPGPGGSAYNGWRIRNTDTNCFLRFDVSGGFAYTKYT